MVGYSAPRHSSGGWNPGAQRAVGRLGERVLSHPSFQRRLESRRAARGGSVGGEGTQPPVIPAEAGIQARKRSVGRLGGEGTQPPVIPAEAGIQARSARWGGWGEGTQPPVIPAEAGIQARKRSVGRLGGEGTAGVGCGVRAWPAQRNERGLSATLDSSLRWNDEASSGRRAFSNGAYAPTVRPRSRIDTRALRW